jgi:hypothetical protein
VTGQFPRTRTTEGLGALTEVEVPVPTASLPGQQRAFESASGCRIIVGLEPARAAPARIWLPPSERELWHLSISHRARLPSWDEVADARYELVPDDVTMALLLPPPGEYLNVHKTTLHLWQIEDRRVEGA